MLRQRISPLLRLPVLLAAWALPTAACRPAAPTSEAQASTSHELGAAAGNVARALAYGKQLVGTPYGWWYSGGIPAGEPMWAAPGAAPAVGSVTATNCAGLTNLMLRAIGKEVPGHGGTGSYGEHYRAVSETFDPGRDYPPGTLLGRYYRDVYDQGHVAVVIEGGYVLQSYADAYGGTYPGVNDWWTVAQSHAGYYYEYAVLPDDWLGGGGGGGECAHGDGYYCGGNGVTGDASTLYRCAGGAASVASSCPAGCRANAAGVNDACN
jgi:hypothetical protein